jgi:hypothetical protein
MATCSECSFRLGYGPISCETCFRNSDGVEQLRRAEMRRKPIVDPLSEAEERDWRQFAFALTREGSTWERSGVQRLFATIDAERAGRRETERQFQAKCDEIGALLDEVHLLRDRLTHLTADDLSNAERIKFISRTMP